MTAAPMAVKCIAQIATVNSAAPAAIAVFPLSAWKASAAAVAMSIPKTTAVPAIARSHSICPSVSSAFMPVKCMRLMPRPIMAPPIMTCRREPPAHSAKPSVVASIAMSRDAAVKVGS